MRILVYSTPIFKLGWGGLAGYGGLEQIAWECARGLAARGHQVGLVCPDGSDCPGVHIIATGPERVTNEFQAWDKVWKDFLTFAPDAVIDHSWSKLSLTLKREGRYKGPVLNVCHAPVNTMFNSLPQGVNFNAVCISGDQKNHFEALFNRKAVRVYNGINPDYYSPLDLPRTDRYLFLGRFSSVKSPDIALETALAAGVGLDVIGDVTITNEPELYNKCMNMADGKQIRIVGNQNRGNCVWWYSQATAMIHPVRNFREPFGLAPIEAMACGCPVIAWRNGAMAETLLDKQTGFLVESQEEIVDLIKTNAVASIDRNKCREWASTFNLDRMVKSYEQAIYEALKKEW